MATQIVVALLVGIAMLGSEIARADDDGEKAMFAGMAETQPNCFTRWKSGKLIMQQLKASRSCVASKANEKWMDCLFDAGKTRVRIVGAVGVSTENRALGNFGTGFHVDAVDPDMSVRVVIVRGLPVVRLDWKNNIDKASGCLYDEAYITVSGVPTRDP